MLVILARAQHMPLETCSLMNFLIGSSTHLMSGLLHRGISFFITFKYHKNADCCECFYSDVYLDQDVDSEVAMVTGNSPESSFDSYSDRQSSIHHDFSDDSESNL
jgi:hypothetical protein